jgi:hypothetical protein
MEQMNKNDDELDGELAPLLCEARKRVCPKQKDAKDLLGGPEKSGPEGSTLVRWENGRGNSLRQLRYVVRLANRDPLFLAGLLRLLNIDHESTWIRLTRKQLEELRLLLPDDALLLHDLAEMTEEDARRGERRFWDKQSELHMRALAREPAIAKLPDGHPVKRLFEEAVGRPAGSAPRKKTRRT